jgi:TatA/E family protein of Tat protein translocase
MLLLFVFEFLGTTELMVILVVALVLFGPRRLPELGRSLGKSLAEFKRATDDFKRTWEREVELDKIERDMRIEHEVNLSPATLTEEGNVPPPLVTDAALRDNADEERTIARQTKLAQSVVDSTNGVDDSTNAATVVSVPVQESAREPERNQP